MRDFTFQAPRAPQAVLSEPEGRWSVVLVLVAYLGALAIVGELERPEAELPAIEAGFAPEVVAACQGAQGERYAAQGWDYSECLADEQARLDDAGGGQ
jgi:hypothetical protein